MGVMLWLKELECSEAKLTVLLGFVASCLQEVRVLSVEANLDGGPVGANANLQKEMMELWLEGMEMQSGSQDLC